jgi:hypothetical protein
MRFEVDISLADLSCQLANVTLHRETYLVQQNNRIVAKMNLSKQSSTTCCCLPKKTKSRREFSYFRTDVNEIYHFKADNLSQNFEIYRDNRICASLRSKKLTVMKRTDFFLVLELRAGTDLVHVLALCHIIKHIHGVS